MSSSRWWIGARGRCQLISVRVFHSLAQLGSFPPFSYLVIGRAVMTPSSTSTSSSRWRRWADEGEGIISSTLSFKCISAGSVLQCFFFNQKNAFNDQPLMKSSRRGGGGGGGGGLQMAYKHRRSHPSAGMIGEEDEWSSNGLVAFGVSLIQCNIHHQEEEYQEEEEVKNEFGKGQWRGHIVVESSLCWTMITRWHGKPQHYQRQTYFPHPSIHLSRLSHLSRLPRRMADGWCGVFWNSLPFSVGILTEFYLLFFLKGFSMCPCVRLLVIVLVGFV